MEKCPAERKTAPRNAALERDVPLCGRAPHRTEGRAAEPGSAHSHRGASSAGTAVREERARSRARRGSFGGRRETSGVLRNLCATTERRPPLHVARLPGGPRLRAQRSGFVAAGGTAARAEPSGSALRPSRGGGRLRNGTAAPPGSELRADGSPLARRQNAAPVFVISEFRCALSSLFFFS